MKHGVHIVGSVPMKTATEVFKNLSAAVGPFLRYLPDGETGPRLDWLPWLEPIFAAHPDFERAPEDYRVHASATPFRRWQLKEGVDPQTVRFSRLPHSGFALDSWRSFEKLKQAGKIPSHVRYQCDIASIPSLLAAFVVEPLHAILEPALEDAVIDEIGVICAAIPHDQLAIQFDVASSIFFYLETGTPCKFGATVDEMMNNFVPLHIRLGNAVPKDVHLLYHFCYGDNRHKHSVEPRDSSHLVNFGNALSSGIGRSIELIHLPVPRERSDDAYFAPLAGLNLRPETVLALGLVHYTDGLEGTHRRIAAAEKVVKGFMIGTECGFGRRDPSTIPELLQIHAQAAAG